MAVVLLAFAALASLLFAIRQPVGFGMFLGLLVGLICGALALLLLAFTYGYFALRYRLSRHALVIRWLGREETVPYQTVDGIFAGARLGQAMRVRGLNWPGYHVGIGRTRAMGMVRYYTTTSDLDDVALIVTTGATYAISPAEPEGFRRDLIARVQSSNEVEASLSDEPPPKAIPVSLRDPILSAAILASIALIALGLLYTWVKWDTLPDVIPIHFSADGTPNQFGPKDDVYKLTSVGVAFLVANVGLGLAIYGRERPLARILWVAASVVQFLILIATARILH